MARRSKTADRSMIAPHVLEEQDRLLAERRAEPLKAVPAAGLSGEEAAAVDHQTALYEAAGRGDTVEFERIRDGRK